MLKILQFFSNDLFFHFFNTVFNHWFAGVSNRTILQKNNFRTILNMILFAFKTVCSFLFQVYDKLRNGQLRKVWQSSNPKVIMFLNLKKYKTHEYILTFVPVSARYACISEIMFTNLMISFSAACKRRTKVISCTKLLSLGMPVSSRVLKHCLTNKEYTYQFFWSWGFNSFHVRSLNVINTVSCIIGSISDRSELKQYIFTWGYHSQSTPLYWTTSNSKISLKLVDGL